VQNLRITKNDLLIKAKRVNKFLQEINITPRFRYGYTALDIEDKEGKIKDTLIAGLTKTEAWKILDCIEWVFYFENP